MKLWLIQRPGNQVDYDEYDGFVVRAETEASARALAAASDYGWSPDWEYTCEPIDMDGPEIIILSSFNAG